MSKQEAIELFNKGSLEESSNLFLQEVINSTDDNHKKDCLEYLVLIHKKFKKEHYEEFVVQLIELYSSLNLHEKVITLYESIDKTNFSLKNIYLKSLWQTTNISKFDKLAQETCRDILTNKIFVHGIEFIKWLKVIRKWLLYPRFALFLLYLEIGNEKEAYEEITELENFIYSKWSKIENKKKNQKDYLKHILNLLESKELLSFELGGFKRLLVAKIFLLNLEERKISKKDLMSLIIENSKDPINLSYLIPLMPNEETQTLLVNYIKKFNKKGMFSPESPFYFLMQNFVVKKSVSVVKNSEKQYFPTSYHIEEDEEKYDESIFDEYLKNEKQIEIEKNELCFKSLIKHTDDEFAAEKESLVVALFELGLYDSSLSLLEKAPVSSNVFYLKIEILFKEKKYTDVIGLVNEAITEFHLDEVNSIPFYYMKAMAYLKLKKESEAQNIFSLISSYNPEFRLLKEKLLSD